jgi:hypothetical protein
MVICGVRLNVNTKGSSMGNPRIGIGFGPQRNKMFALTTLCKVHQE